MSQTGPETRTIGQRLLFVIVVVFCLAPVDGCNRKASVESDQNGQSREEVVFWHFWGGKDGEIVDDVVARFNASQDQFRVRAIAMPGNNLDTKLFLSIAGGDPPDLVNQDDPIVADWAYRGIIEPFDAFVPEDELNRVVSGLLPSARRLGEFDGKTFAVANGLDIRALIYNKTFLDQRGLRPPKTMREFESVCLAVSPPTQELQPRYAYLPDARRLWTWSYVFGGECYDISNETVSLSHGKTLTAAEWMQKFSQQYGADNVSAFRQGDQSLPGKTFPLLPIDDQEMAGRYIFILAGQWNTRDVKEFIAARKERGVPAPEFGVCPLPHPEGGRPNGGWVNGNIFVVPRGAKCKQGAWEFAKFWIGTERPQQAATTCAEGGWIPVTHQVIKHERFRRYLDANPLFAEYVRLAESPNQFPYPMVPGAPFFVRTVNATMESLIANPELSVIDELSGAEQKIQRQLDSVKEQYR